MLFFSDSISYAFISPLLSSPATLLFLPCSRLQLPRLSAFFVEVYHTCWQQCANLWAHGPTSTNSFTLHICFMSHANTCTSHIWFPLTLLSSEGGKTDRPHYVIVESSLASVDWERYSQIPGTSSPEHLQKWETLTFLLYVLDIMILTKWREENSMEG